MHLCGQNANAGDGAVTMARARAKGDVVNSWDRLEIGTANVTALWILYSCIYKIPEGHDLIPRHAVMSTDTISLRCLSREAGTSWREHDRLHSGPCCSQERLQPRPIPNRLNSTLTEWNNTLICISLSNNLHGTCDHVLQSIYKILRAHLREVTTCARTNS